MISPLRAILVGLGVLLFAGAPRLVCAQSAGAKRPSLHARIGERFLSRWLAQTDCRSAPVVDYALDSHIRGEQSTLSSLTVDLRPSRSEAVIDLVLQGTVHSDTHAFGEQAVVATLGQHEFIARKPVRFDGRRFRTKVPDAWIRPHNQVVGVQTRYSHLPLIGPLADRIGYREALRRTPESDRVAVDRVARNVLPTFNREADRLLGEANTAWTRQVRRPLIEADLSPQNLRVYSTDQSLRVAARWPRSTADSLPPAPQLPEGEGLALALHESLLNGFLARFELPGRVIPLADLLDAVTEYIGDAEGEIPEEFAAPLKIRFAEDDPIVFRVDQNELRVTVRASFETEGAPSRYDEVSVGLGFELDGDVLSLTPSAVRVEPLGDYEQTPLDRVRREIIRNQIEARLETSQLPAVRQIPLENGRSVPFRLRRLVGREGWLVMEAE